MLIIVHLKSSKVFGKYKVSKMELRKTWLNKNPIILCYPEKGQHEFTVFMDSSPGIQPRLKKKRGESQMLDVDSKAKDQGG